MKHQRKTLAASMEAVGERQIRVRCSTEGVDRAGDIVVQTGVDLSGYRNNPVMLWQHNPDMPVAKAVECGLVNGMLEALAEFPPAGISVKADEICGLVKAGIINAVSIGLDVSDAEPIDPKRPRGPQKFNAWELMEISFVSVPANRDAIVIARDLNSRKQTMPLKIKGLYDVGQLAYLMAQFGYITDAAQWESEIEGDESKVPGMLGDALKQIGETLIAMTQEEVAELLANLETPDVAPEDDRYVTAGKTPAIQRFRRGIAHAKAVRTALVVKSGKKISAATAKALQGALDKHMEASAMQKKATGMHDDACAVVKSLLEDDFADPDEDGETIGDDAPSPDKKARAARMKAARLLAVSPL